MRDQEINIAIAEACGWTDICSAGLDWGLPPKTWTLPVRRGYINPNRSEIPDYCNDLNAMHEAEKVLTEDQQEQYLNNLYEVCNLHSMINDAWNLNCATAAQRAEAFLRTIGKWEEAEK